MIEADLLITNISQLATCAGADGPKRGAALADVGLIADAAVAVADGGVYPASLII